MHSGNIGKKRFNALQNTLDTPKNLGVARSVPTSVMQLISFNINQSGGRACPSAIGDRLIDLLGRVARILVCFRSAVKAQVA